MKSKLPKHMLSTYGSSRTWKKIFRKRIRRLEMEFDALRYGCAYSNAKNGEISKIEEAIASLKKSCSVKEWGR